MILQHCRHSSCAPARAAYHEFRFVGGCDLSQLHIPEGAVERMDLGGCLLEGAVIDGAHREALEQRGPLGLDSVRWQ